jgi:glycosyltransferase involved in cell wall biosynthesis
VAFRHGSVPEVMVDGETGFIVGNVADAVAAVERVAQLNRRRCRRAFESRFTAQRMARDYLGVYRKLCGEEPSWRVA